MSEHTHISWTDSTWNPWIGCTKVSSGCDHCYAEALMDKRYKRVIWGHGNERQRTSESNWRKPIQWNEVAWKERRRQKVFCASLADVFDTEVPIEWLRDLLELIRVTSCVDWQLLTKRPAAILPRLFQVMEAIGDETLLHRWLFDWVCVRNGAPRNVWLGTSCEDQQTADVRIPALIKVPAIVRFLSCEPLLGPIDLLPTGALGKPCQSSYSAEYGRFCLCCKHIGLCDAHDIDWVIVGGESGKDARPMHPGWARAIRDQCENAGVPFFFKQWGEFAPVIGDPKRDDLWILGENGFVQKWERGDQCAPPGKFSLFCDEIIRRVGKRAAGDLLDGVQHHNFPGCVW